MKSTALLFAFALIPFVVSHLRGAPEEDSHPSYLFTIDKAGQPTSYLFGTIHLPDPRVTRLKPNVVEAFRGSAAVYCEIEMDPAARIGLLPEMMLPPGETLADLLPADLLARLDQELRRIDPDLTITPFMQFKIWAVVASLVLLEPQTEHPNIKPMDLALYRLAAASGKRTGGIETGQEQMSYFEAFSRPEQIAMLRSTLDLMAKLRAKNENFTDELVEAYQTGDLRAIEELLNAYRDEDPALQAKFERIFIHERNELMAERIADILRESPDEPVFFAVGVAHLFGETGIPTLLRDRGFIVERAPGSK